MRTKIFSLYLLLLFFSIPACLFAQKQEYDTDTKKFFETNFPGYTVGQIDTMGHTYTSVSLPAEFRGGLKGWTAYLEKNLNVDLGNKYIRIKKGDSTARQTAIVLFTVDVTGLVSNVTTEPQKGQELHSKLAAEAIRVVAEGPRWEPAQWELFENVNGAIPLQAMLDKKKKGLKKVIYRHKQSITFVVSVEK